MTRQARLVAAPQGDDATLPPMPTDNPRGEDDPGLKLVPFVTSTDSLAAPG